MKRRTLRTRTKQFLYKAMHGTQKVGEYWRHLGDSAPREFCSVCRTTESMEHILIRCQATPPRLIWTLAKDLWPHDQIPWLEISLGIILGSGTITLPPAEPQKTANQQESTHQRPSIRGAGCLFQILISEAAYLIWVLRYERVVREPPRTHTVNEIEARWFGAINTRLTQDKLMATRIKRNEQSIRLVKETWEPALKQSLDIPNDWIYNREVLVGRRTERLAFEGDML